MNNQELFESDEALEKYTAKTSRVRCLNETEKNFIDQFQIADKKVLVIGSGAGRVPANLLLFGNRVVGVERSENLLKAARESFPKEDFKRVDFVRGEARNLKDVAEGNFEVVFFPQGGIDYAEDYTEREGIIKEMASKVAPGGFLAITTHNKTAYYLSYKVRWRNKIFWGFFKDYIYDRERVTAGGRMCKATASFTIKEVERLTGFKTIGFTCDTRNRWERLLARKLGIAKFVFPLVLLVFKRQK